MSGTVVFGPYEFLGPKGYWYVPHSFPRGGLRKGEDFLVTFFHSRSDLPAKRVEDYRPPKSVVFNFLVFGNQFKDVRSYYEAVSKANQSAGISESDLSFRDLRGKTKLLFADIGKWSCREEVAKGYPPLFTISCIMLSDHAIIMSAHGDESEVLDKASMLSDMIKSLRVDRIKRGRK